MTNIKKLLGNMPSIEKAILADVCLGIPLGQIVFSIPSHLDLDTSVSAPDTYLFRGEQLALMKLLCERGDAQTSEAISALTQAADEAMGVEPFSVTQKPRSRFSDDPHNYESLAKYWWPNPDTEDSLPYLNRDGEINPECYSVDFDYTRLVRFSETVVLLALAAYLTGRAQYGERASLLLETWFVNPETRQTPHFRFGQTIPGQETLRWQAIIETRFLVYVTEAVRLVSHQDALKPTSKGAIHDWFADLLKWMLESEHGLKAKKATNNIGFWYDIQCMVYAHFCGKVELVERIILDDVAPRLDAQMAADGSLPGELARAHPKDYVAFTLAAMTLISRAGEHSGLAIWDQREGDGRNFQAAHDWLMKTGEARQLLSGVATRGNSADEPTEDLGLLLDAGVKLRGFQRVAETATQVASRARAELETAAERETNLRVQLDAETSLRQEFNNENLDLQKELMEAQANLEAELDEATDALRVKRDAEIKALRQKRVGNDARLQTRLAQREAEIETLKKQLEDSRKKVRHLTSDAEASLKYASALKDSYRAVLASTSWRAMGPLRVVVRQVKSLRHGKKYGPSRMPKAPAFRALSQSSRKVDNKKGDKKKSVNLKVVTTPPAPAVKPEKNKKTQPKSASPAKIMVRATYTPESGRIVGTEFRKKTGILSRAEKSLKKLPPAAKAALKAMRDGAPPDFGVLKTISRVASKVRPERADPLQMLLAARPHDEDALKKEYREKGLQNEPDSFVLYRIIGNDLYPRHKKGQSRENVQFLLENEPELAGCEKRWVVNRIIDPEEERQMISMLQLHSQPYIHIPFIAEEYRKLGWDFDALPARDFLDSKEFQGLETALQDRVRVALYRLKNNYVMNNNGARNAALRDGRACAKWVLPWDGNCFVTAKSWREIRQTVTSEPHLKYFAVPMERIIDNTMLLRDDFTPHPVEEPQLLFRRDAREEFNEHLAYGRRPKVELFWRLGIPGPWDSWEDDPWDQKRREMSPESHQFGVAGWVGRLYSGREHLEARGQRGASNRNRARQEAIISMLNSLDAALGIDKSNIS